MENIFGRLGSIQSVGTPIFRGVRSKNSFLAKKTRDFIFQICNVYFWKIGFDTVLTVYHMSGPGWKNFENWIFAIFNI